MTHLVTILDRGDPWMLTGVVVFVLIVAHWLTDTSGIPICAWVATVAIIAYGCYRFYVRPPRSADDLMDVAIRAALSGGMALGISRLLWPTLRFLVHYAILRPWEDFRASIRERAHRRESYAPPLPALAPLPAPPAP